MTTIVFDILSWYEPGINAPEDRSEEEKLHHRRDAGFDWCAAATLSAEGHVGLVGLVTRNIRPICPVPSHLMPQMDRFLSEQQKGGHCRTYDEACHAAYWWLAKNWNSI